MTPSNLNVPEYLATLPTRQLMAYRNRCYRYEGSYRIINALANTFTDVTVEQLNAVLATREHVPSKSEGKVLRRIMATTGMNEQQVRANPKYQHELAGVQGKRLVDAHTLSMYSRYAPSVAKHMRLKGT